MTDKKALAINWIKKGIQFDGIETTLRKLKGIIGRVTLKRILDTGCIRKDTAQMTIIRYMDIVNKKYCQ